MVISLVTNNQAYLTTQNTVNADVNKPGTAVNKVDERVNTVVEDNKESSLKIADRLAERSNQPALQQKEEQNTLANLQNTKSVLSDLENVASQLSEAIEKEDAAEGSETVAQLRAQLKDLTKQLKTIQGEEQSSSDQTNSVGGDKEVTVKFNGSELSSIAETLNKIELTEDSQAMAKQHLSGEAGLMNKLAQTRSQLDMQLQDAYATHSIVDNSSVQQASEVSKSSMLDESGAKQLTGTKTTADVAVSILS